jgi:hypothetical protein
MKPAPRSPLIPRNKFGNIRTEIDGLSFASKREARRYSELRLLVKAGQITDLKTQVRYPLEVNGQLVCNYVADFAYIEGGELVVEDAKGYRTPEYVIKAKLMRAVHAIDVREV